MRILEGDSVDAEKEDSGSIQKDREGIARSVADQVVRIHCVHMFIHVMPFLAQSTRHLCTLLEAKRAGSRSTNVLEMVLESGPLCLQKVFVQEYKGFVVKRMSSTLVLCGDKEGAFGSWLSDRTGGLPCSQSRVANTEAV